jgi:hypothetical protein
MRDSNVANAAKESAQAEFPHGLQEFCAAVCDVRFTEDHMRAVSG